MKTVQIGQNQTDTYQGKCVLGLEIGLQLQALAAATVLAPTDVLMRNISVNCVLQRGGQKYEIVSTTLDVMIKYANYHKAPVKALWAVNTGLAAAIPAVGVFNVDDAIIQQETALVKDIRFIPCQFHFTSPICLRGEDKLTVTVNAAPGSVINNGDPTQSFVQFAEIDGHGHERGIPKFVVQAIQQNQANVQVGAGNGVDEILFVNTDRQDSTVANSVIQQVSVNSGKHSYAKIYTQLLTMRSNESSVLDADYHLADFILFDGDDDNNVSVNMNLNVTNVTAGNNYVVIASCLSSNEHRLSMHNQATRDHATHLHSMGLISPAQLNAIHAKHATFGHG